MNKERLTFANHLDKKIEQLEEKLRSWELQTNKSTAYEIAYQLKDLQDEGHLDTEAEFVANIKNSLLALLTRKRDELQAKFDEL